MAEESSPLPHAPWPYGVPIPQRFSSKYQRYQQLGGIVDVTEDARAYAGEAPLRDVERLMFLSLAIDQIHKEGLEGDLAELGVYKGSTAAVLARYARRLDRKIYLMDTYEGFNEQDFSGLDAGRGSGFTDTSLEAVRARVGEANTTYIKGYFPQTASQLPEDGRYCLVHIDTDLYAPITSGLEYFYPRMVPGGFLIIHDYGSLAWAGAEKAIDQFFANKPECVIHIPDSSGSAVVRRQRQSGTGPTWIGKRQILARNEWHSAANGQLSSILSEGWSAPEGWGTWGVGASHQITLRADGAASQSIVVDLDLHAFVWEEADGRQFDILVNGQASLQPKFTAAQNRQIVSLENVHPADDGLLIIEIRPRKVAVPKDVKPSNAETRTLGVALHRVRVR
jgi:Macrocin-O-methyltransferase (TylF)